MKYTCHLNRCEWANGKSGNCVWPGTYCPRQAERDLLAKKIAYTKMMAEAIRNVEVDDDSQGVIATAPAEQGD